jgi:hypothetical protein
LASSSPAHLNLSRCSIALKGSWAAGLRAENDYRDLRWSDEYAQGSLLNLSYKTSLGKTLSYLETSGQITGIADRSIEWPEGFTDQRLVGNFTVQGKARWKRTSSRVSPPSKDELDCCMLIGERAVMDEV